jgi:arylsulfatase A-like enzyme
MSDPKRPHIIIFNPDQWRGGALGHLGDPAAQTPHIDALVAADAVSFRNAFCQNTVCTPSRCSFMTGLYPHVHGHRTMQYMLHPEHGQDSLPQVLRRAGYHFWWGGKNDLYPAQNGFDGVCDTKFRPTADDLKRWGYPEVIDPAWGPQTPAGRDDHYGFRYGCFPGLPDGKLFPNHDLKMVYGAIDFIGQHDDAEPCCVYLPLQFPHPPYSCEQRFFDAIDPAAIPPRTPAVAGAAESELRRRIRENQDLGHWTEADWLEIRQLYYGMCMRVDHLFGELVAALKRRGIYDDCLIVILSDHGDFTGDFSLAEKSQNSMEDCLCRVPFVVKPPKGSDLVSGPRDQLCELIDMPATIYDLLEIDPGYDHFGRSLVPLFADAAAAHREAAFCEGGRLAHEDQASERTLIPAGQPIFDYYPRLQVQRDEPQAHGKATMCHTGRYKYIRRLVEGDQLFDLARDPGEQTNLIDDPAHAAIRQQMVERMLTWYQATCDVVPRALDQR